MAGSNNVDHILSSPRHLREQLLVHGKGNAKTLDETNRGIEKLVLYLHKWAPEAIIRIINILPRESRVRNTVISDINQFISKLQNRYSFVSYISTEKYRNLFTDKLGYRKQQYFSSNGDDNIHLNRLGVIRLANHLKYTVHHIC